MTNRSSSLPSYEVSFHCECSKWVTVLSLYRRYTVVGWEACRVRSLLGIVIDFVQNFQPERIVCPFFAALVKSFLEWM
jgi:hypothetical protein